MVCLDHHQPTDRLLLIESNNSDTLRVNGVGYRGLGQLHRFDGLHPGSEWWRYRECPTWGEFRKNYVRLAACTVPVVGQSPRPWEGA